MAASECFTDSIYTLCLRVADGSLQVYDQDNDEVLASFSTEYERDGIFNNKQLLEGLAESTATTIEVGLVNKPQSFGGVIFDDWFLPSQAELLSMFTNLHQEGVGGFSNYVYWSSTETDSINAYAYGFGLGGFVPEVLTKSLEHAVRPARSFTLTEAVPSYALRDIGPAGGWIFIVVDNGNGTYTYYEAAPENSSNAIVWSNIDNVAIGTTGANVGDGEQNTLDIIGQSGHTGGAAQNATDYYTTVEGGHILVTTEVEAEAGIVNETQGISLESDVDIDAEVSIVNSEQSISSEVAMQGKIEMSVVNAGQGVSSEAEREADVQTSVVNAGQSINKTSTVNNLDIPAGWRLPTEAEWEAERWSWDSFNAVGAFGSPLKLTAGGSRLPNNGSLYSVGLVGYYWSSTADGVYSQYQYFYTNAYTSISARARGCSIRLIKESGLPLVSGDQSFTYNGASWTYQEIENPTTGRIWMDRNLGASQVATVFDDSAAYGDLLQWGRNIDGHQVRTSGTTATLSSTDTPGHGDFITNSESPNDWRDPKNDDLWQIDSVALQVIVDTQTSIINTGQGFSSEVDREAETEVSLVNAGQTIEVSLTENRIIESEIFNDLQTLSSEVNNIINIEATLINNLQDLASELNIELDIQVSIENELQTFSAESDFIINTEIGINNEQQVISSDINIINSIASEIINELQIVSAETDLPIDAEISISNGLQTLVVMSYLDAEVLQIESSITNNNQAIEGEILVSPGISGGIFNEEQQIEIVITPGILTYISIINEGQDLSSLILISTIRNIEITLSNKPQTINDSLLKSVTTIPVVQVSITNEEQQFSSELSPIAELEVSILNKEQSFSGSNTIHARGAMLHGAFFLAIAQNQEFENSWIIPITGSSAGILTEGEIVFTASEDLSVHSDGDVTIESIARSDDAGYRKHVINISCISVGSGNIEIEHKDLILSLGNHMGANNPNIRFYTGINTSSPILNLDLNNIPENIEKIRQLGAYNIILPITGNQAMPSNLKYLHLSGNNISWDYSGSLPLLTKYVYMDSNNINWTGSEFGSSAIPNDFTGIMLLNYRSTLKTISELLDLLEMIDSNTNNLPVSITIKEYDEGPGNPTAIDIRDAVSDIAGTPAEQGRYWMDQILGHVGINKVILNITEIT